MKRIFTIGISVFIITACLFSFASCGNEAEPTITSNEEPPAITNEQTSYEHLAAFVVSNGVKYKSANSTYEYTIHTNEMKNVKISYIPISDRLSMSYAFIPEELDISFVTTFDISLSDIDTVCFDIDYVEGSDKCRLSGELSKRNMSVNSTAKVLSMAPDDYENRENAVNFGIRSVISSLNYLNDLMLEEELGTVSDFGFSDTLEECYGKANL